MIKNRRLGFIQAAIPLALLLIVGGGAIAWNIYGGGGKSSDEIVNSALTKFIDAKSFNYDVDVSVDATGRVSLNGTSLPGVSDILKNKAGNFFLSFDGVVNNAGAVPVFSSLLKLDSKTSDSRNNLSGELEARFLGDALYLRFKADKLGLTGPAAMANAFSDKWIKIDNSAIEQFAGEGSSEEVKEALEQHKKIRTAVREVLSKHKILTVSSELGEEDLGGSKADHYKVVVSKEALASALSELIERVSDALPEETKADKPTEEEIERMKEGITKADFPEFDLWVDSSGFPRKIAFAGEAEGPTAKEGMKYSISIVLGSFGQDLKVEVPSGAKSIEELFSAMFSGFNTGESDFGGGMMDKNMMFPR